MNFELIPFTSNFIQKQAVAEVIKCNDYTAGFGLILTPEQALESDPEDYEYANQGKTVYLVNQNGEIKMSTYDGKGVGQPHKK